MSQLTKAVALTVLALWGLAAMHCKLEAVPGLGFLQSCCSPDAEASTPTDCENDGCGLVEDGGYRAEEPTVAAPHPAPILALISPAREPVRPEPGPRSCVPFRSPPEISQAWQFAYRTALPPRAPSLAS